jgi:hypothetical protein
MYEYEWMILKWIQINKIDIRRLVVGIVIIVSNLAVDVDVFNIFVVVVDTSYLFSSSIKLI